MVPCCAGRVYRPVELVPQLRMKLLDAIPLVPLLIVAVLLGAAPFPMQAEPHLIEKLRMLFTGTLSRPIDILDLFLHGGPLVVVVLKLVRMGRAEPQR